MMVPNFDNSGLTLRTRYRSLPTAESRHEFSYSTNSSLVRPAPSAAMTCSAASMPLPIALCTPLMRGTLTKPAAQPISAPPAKLKRGTD